MSAEIIHELPFLRRFARALTGSQASGDHYVSAALEALIADPSSLPIEMSTKVGLFHVLLKVWGSVDLNRKSEQAGGGDDAVADRRLERITPLPRQAFLLVALESFSTKDAAAALGTTTENVQRLLEQAAAEIGLQLTTDVLIIEDEPLIAMHLEDLVGSLGHRVTGNARTRDEAIDLVAKSRPGLVLADIQLADGSSGLDAVNDILGSFEVPVIFITAFPERLLTGERPEPTFLITKPFQATMVKAIISQALFFENNAARRSAA
jgi:DNA-directed RNA polymerase specialized sigma24 family protein